MFDWVERIELQGIGKPVRVLSGKLNLFPPPKKGHLVNPRWIDIPEDSIYGNLRKLGIRTWGERAIWVGGFERYYLFGGDFAYPYSLPRETIGRLAERLNEAIDMTWYKKYNALAMDYFNAHGEALNEAREYWHRVNDPALPKPEILPVDGLSEGDEYIAIIGLFHLPGSENGNNHHLFIDLIDEAGNRIYDHTPPLFLWYGWEGITPEQEARLSSIRIDKPDNEPGANIGLSWNQIIYGFHINNIATDRFRNIHVRYPDDQTGNARGHHSHYIILQKRTYTTPTPGPDPKPEPPKPDPDPEPQEAVMMIKKSWLDKQPVEDGFIVIYGDSRG